MLTAPSATLHEIVNLVCAKCLSSQSVQLLISRALHQSGGVKAQALVLSVHVAALSSSLFLHACHILNYLGKAGKLALYVRIFLCGCVVMNVLHWAELSALIYKARIKFIQKSYAFTIEMSINPKKHPPGIHKLRKK